MGSSSSACGRSPAVVVPRFVDSALLAQRKRSSGRASRRRRRRIPRPRPSASRLAAGRSPAAYDWVAGLGWLNPGDGSFHIEIPLALHHDQARAMQRTVDAVGRYRTLTPDLAVVWGTDVQLLTLPLTSADAQRVLVVLQRRARSGAEPFRGATRIGLGLDRRLERRLVAITFRRLSVTGPDGAPTVPIGPALLGRVDAACRVDGRVDAGGVTADLSDLDGEPVWAAGVGYPRPVPGVPVITSVLALGHTAPLAAARGMALDLVPGVFG